MKKVSFLMLFMGISFLIPAAFADECPDPQSSSLKWGEPPAPWEVNPFSPNRPQGDDSTRFLHANILVTNTFGKGVTCTYRMSLGEYSIWRSVATKVPAPSDYKWIKIQGGYICTQGIEKCQFSIAEY